VQFRPNPLPIYWMMGASVADVVNLKRFKKQASREQAASLADANRARFGRTKAERTLDETRASRAKSLLDQHLLGGEDAS
jgi:superfamily II RNA helicase